MNDNDFRSYNILRRFKVISLMNALVLFKDGGFKAVNKKIQNKRKHITDNQEYQLVKDRINFKPGFINLICDNEDIYNKIIIVLKDESNISYFVISKNNIKSDNVICLSYEKYKEVFKYRSFVLISEKKRSLNDFPYGKCIIYTNKIKNEITKMLGTINGLKYYANYENKNTITAKTSTFFDFKGANYYSGGAERYLVDLYEVCKNMNINFDIYQNAEVPFFRKFRNINVIGVANDICKMNFTETYFKTQMQKYIALTQDKTQLNIYSAFQECYPYKYGPSIGISHGISWDNPANKDLNPISFWNSKKLFINSAKACDKLVSVDNNTANWFQTLDYEIGNQKFKVIPNYVDTNEFCPAQKKKNSEKIVITYPRRLYEPRGMYLLLDSVDYLFKKYQNIEIHFVGKGFDEDVNAIKAKMKKYPNRLFCYSSQPEQMNEIYKKSDISLVPTLYSEGTSLSCLEALSTGNIVVCTRIGGLTDLIINGLNGYLIEPTKESLISAIENIIDNYDKQDVIRKNAIKTAETFNKDIWREKWTNVIKSFPHLKSSKNIKLAEFIVEDASNINNKTFELIKQHLKRNELVYIRSKNKLINDNISFGLLQVIGFDDEVASLADNLYVEKSINVNRKEKIHNI